MKHSSKLNQRNTPYSNRIPLPFHKIVEGMLQVKPEKKPAKPKKKLPKK